MLFRSQSAHPLASAIVRYLEHNSHVPLEINHFESLTGQGIWVHFQGADYWAGNRSLMDQFHADLTEEARQHVELWESDGKSVVYYGKEQVLLAVMAITDQVKTTSKEAVMLLKQAGIEVHLLTGDSQATAQRVAASLHITHVMAGALPAEKEAYIQQLQQQGKRVAMVGDGINDSQALARADVSIAMGKGTDIAMDVAMVTLITSDLLLLPASIRLSRQTVRLIYQNLFWAFIYNLIGIPLAAGVLFPVNGLLLNPMIASAAMAFSSVSVVLNSLRLKLKK